MSIHRSTSDCIYILLCCLSQRYKLMSTSISRKTVQSHGLKWMWSLQFKYFRTMHVLFKMRILFNSGIYLLLIFYGWMSFQRVILLFSKQKCEYNIQTKHPKDHANLTPLLWLCVLPRGTMRPMCTHITGWEESNLPRPVVDYCWVQLQ